MYQPEKMEEIMQMLESLNIDKDLINKIRFDSHKHYDKQELKKISQEIIEFSVDGRLNEI
jgi:hypothetical protein